MVAPGPKQDSSGTRTRCLCARNDLLCLRSLRSLTYLVFHFLAFSQGLVTVLLDRGIVNKEVFALSRVNEAIAFGVAEPLDFAEWHDGDLLPLSLVPFAKVTPQHQTADGDRRTLRRDFLLGSRVPIADYHKVDWLSRDIARRTQANLRLQSSLLSIPYVAAPVRRTSSANSPFGNSRSSSEYAYRALPASRNTRS